MSPYIKSLADEIANRYIKNGMSDENKVLSKVRDELFEIKAEKDKLGLLSIVLEANEVEYQNHLRDCKNPNSCSTNKQHQRVSYFLQQELEEIGMNINSDHFTWEEKTQCNAQLDDLIETLTASNQILSEQLEILRIEIEELKNLYVLGKKNWKQQFAGKLSEMLFSGVISELTAKPIINNIFKPGIEYISINLLS
ncbi:MAG: hypothetical protein KA521_05540 [Crocinitomicaceae bacterium]|nr:hypothetical protein [Crocinitomicaceae bacterium]